MSATGDAPARTAPVPPNWVEPRAGVPTALRSGDLPDAADVVTLLATPLLLGEQWGRGDDPDWLGTWLDDLERTTVAAVLAGVRRPDAWFLLVPSLLADEVDVLRRRAAAWPSVSVEPVARLADLREVVRRWVEEHGVDADRPLLTGRLDHGGVVARDHLSVAAGVARLVADDRRGPFRLTFPYGLRHDTASGGTHVAMHSNNRFSLAWSPGAGDFCTPLVNHTELFAASQVPVEVVTTRRPMWLDVADGGAAGPVRRGERVTLTAAELRQRFGIALPTADAPAPAEAPDPAGVADASPTAPVAPPVPDRSAEILARLESVERAGTRVHAQLGQLGRHLLTQHDAMALAGLVTTVGRGVLPPLPSSFSASASTLQELVELVTDLDHAPTVLECGSGGSTFWLAAACRARGDGHVVALEHDAGYARATTRALERADLGAWATVVVAPLTAHDHDGGQVTWYDLSTAGLPTAVDLLFVDGPPQSVGAHARYPAFPLLADRLVDGAVVVVDDADRAGEADAIHRWEGEVWSGRSLEAFGARARHRLLRVRTGAGAGGSTTGSGTEGTTTGSGADVTGERAPA